MKTLTNLVLLMFLLIVVVCLFITNKQTENLTIIENWQEQWKAPLREAGVPENGIIHCMRWAFGDNAMIQKWNKAPELWNERHGDIFIIYSSDDRYKTFVKVGKAYLKRNKIK